MRRTFADLHLNLDPRNIERTEHIVGKAASLQYRLIGVPFSSQVEGIELVRVRTVCNKAGIDLASRIDLRPRTRGQLMNQLRKLRRKFEIVCVLCENKEVARQAAKDRRVDLLNFPATDYTKRYFDRAEAELASKSLASLEIDAKPILLLDGVARIRLLSSLRKEVSTAKDFNVPVVFSSDTSSELLLRKPMELAALTSLFGFDEVSGLNAVSANPLNIVRRNRAKLNAGFIAPGIRLIKEGVDC